MALFSLALAWSSCFRDPDVSKMKCIPTKGCPKNFVCVKTGEEFRCQSAGVAGQDGAVPVTDAPVDSPRYDGAREETAGPDVRGRDGASAEAAIPIDSRMHDAADAFIADANQVVIDAAGAGGTGGVSALGGTTGSGGAGGGAGGTGGADWDAGRASDGGGSLDGGLDVPSGGSGGGPGTGGSGTGGMSGQGGSAMGGTSVIVSMGGSSVTGGAGAGGASVSGGAGAGGTTETGGSSTGGTTGTGGATCSLAGASGASTLSVDVSGAQTLIPKELFGVMLENLGRQFFNGGLFVGTDSTLPNINGMRQDVIEGLQEAGIGLMKFPGGCSAKDYDWSTNKNPAKDVGTDRFMELCELVGAEPYITGKPREVDAASNAAWVDYIQDKWSLKYFKIGDEVWGCGGSMDALTYQASYEANRTRLTGRGLFLVAGGYHLQDHWDWYESMVTNIGDSIDGIDLQDIIYYPETVSCTDFTENQYYDIVHRANTGQVQPNLDTLIGILDERDPDKRIKIGMEWGDWLKDTGDGWQQQNTVMDAISAAEQLHLFMARAHRIQIAVLWDAVNVMHSLMLIAPEDGPMAKTSTFYVFKMFIPHHSAGAKLAPSTLDSEKITANDIPALSASASVNDQGRVHVSLVNVDAANSHTLQISLNSSKTGYTVQSAQVVTGPATNSYNVIGGPESVNIQTLAADNYAICGKELNVTLPARSVVMLALDPQ